MICSSFDFEIQTNGLDLFLIGENLEFLRRQKWNFSSINRSSTTSDERQPSADHVQNFNFGITCYTKWFWASVCDILLITNLGGLTMAHMEKFSRGSVNGLSIHIERKTVTHSNKDIDPERSYLNYDLCQKSGDMNERLARRLRNVHCLNRENVKVMADWIVTLPEATKDSPREDQRIFFETSYTFLADRYGQENVLAGMVHNDETTPHMHFAFIPVTFDQKKQREKVSAKEVLNRKELLAFHKELDTYLKEHIPEIYTYGILNDKTIGVDDVGTLKKHGEKIKEMKEELTSKTEDLFTQIEEKTNKKRCLSTNCMRSGTTIGKRQKKRTPIFSCRSD